MPDVPKNPRKKSRKRPCSICRRWLVPDARVGARQRACGQAECQAARRVQTQAGWRARNRDYCMARRILARKALSPVTPEPLRLPPPLEKLPWDLAQAQFGVAGADFIGLMGALILRSTQDQRRLQGFDSTAVPPQLPLPAVRHQFRLRSD
jgi:hypothetical protein